MVDCVKLRKLFKIYKDFPKEGCIFYDIHPLMSNAPVRNSILDHYAFIYNGKVDIIVGLESRGYYFAIPLAFQLGIPFVPIRKIGKLPGPVETASYSLEYGNDFDIHFILFLLYSFYFILKRK